MKLFAFVGKTFNHIDSLIDSNVSTIVTVSDTIGVYADTQKQVAMADRDTTLAEAKAEGKLRLLELRNQIEQAKVNKPAEVDVSKSIDDLLADLG